MNAAAVFAAGLVSGAYAWDRVMQRHAAAIDRATALPPAAPAAPVLHLVTYNRSGKEIRS